MDEKNIQTQINELNNKVDLILDYVNQQRLKSGAVDDLISDVSIIGKDLYDSVVSELDNQSVEIDPEELQMLGIKLIKNIKNFNTLLDLLESITDFAKDASPIVNEIIIDFTKKIHVFEQKGYFEFFVEISKVLDNIITKLSPKDIKQLSDNVGVILEIVKNFSQPEILNLINNSLVTFNNVAKDDIPKYSMWKLFKEMRSSEMKKTLGFALTFIKNFSNTDNIKK
ncbi:MAG: DUF1641 domain-containing protein [Bacteroidales bacterium]|nr:DUF1641 domain-containing protein [Bacteroidales bacterium]